MPPVPATEQLRRLLVMIPWLSARGRVSLDEVARAFHISTKQAEADVNQAMMIGVPPYTGGCYVNVFLDADGDVVADPGPYLAHPPKLTPAQGFALLASARAVLDDGSVAGAESPLASAVAKLERTLGDTHVVGVDLQSPPNLDVVRDAVEAGTQLRIEYYAAWRDDVTDRVVDPQVVFQRNGRWYVQAWCHRANDVRRFRIDRIRSIEPCGSFPPVRAEPPTDVWDPGADAQRVVIDIPASARWVIEAYPVEWEQHGEMLRVTMNVLGTAWLERLLLKVGPEARVIEPASLRSVGADAARRLLEAY
jgi:proteasome accessory factor C